VGRIAVAGDARRTVALMPLDWYEFQSGGLLRAMD
jgi:hypothetical protein